MKGSSVREAIVNAGSAASAGAEATADMVPRLGRSSYLGDRARSSRSWRGGHRVLAGYA